MKVTVNVEKAREGEKMQADDHDDAIGDPLRPLQQVQAHDEGDDAEPLDSIDDVKSLIPLGPFRRARLVC
jgi:hypothetical protein